MRGSLALKALGKAEHPVLLGEEEASKLVGALEEIEAVEFLLDPDLNDVKSTCEVLVNKD
jgi:hypothetical protein